MFRVQLVSSRLVYLTAKNFNKKKYLCKQLFHIDMKVVVCVSDSLSFRHSSVKHLGKKKLIWL